MPNQTEAGIAAAKNGDVAQARTLLLAAVQADASDATAWLWLSSVITAPEERRYCLLQVLAAHPGSPAATKRLQQLGPGGTRSPLLEASVAPVVAATTVILARPKRKRNGLVLVLSAVLGIIGVLVIVVVIGNNTEQPIATKGNPYLDLIRPEITQIQSALEDIEAATKSTRSANWSQDVELEQSVLRQSYRNLVAITNVPSAYTDAHDALVEATNTCIDSVSAMIKGDGDLDTAQLVFMRCDRRMGQAADMFVAAMK